MNYMYDFGLLLKQLRKQKGLTQAQLAKKIHKSKTVISKYENNVLNPTTETLTEFAVIFNVSLDYLKGLNSKNGLSLNGLSEGQTDILLRLANAFREKKPVAFHSLNDRQLELIKDIIEEFSRTAQ